MSKLTDMLEKANQAHPDLGKRFHGAAAVVPAVGAGVFVTVDSGSVVKGIKASLEESSEYVRAGFLVAEGDTYEAAKTALCETASWAGGAAIGMKVGATMGSVVPGAGTLVGAGAGLVGGVVIGAAMEPLSRSAGETGLIIGDILISQGLIGKPSGKAIAHEPTHRFTLPMKPLQRYVQRFGEEDTGMLFKENPELQSLWEVRNNDDRFRDQFWTLQESGGMAIIEKYFEGRDIRAINSSKSESQGNLEHPERGLSLKPLGT